MRAEGAGSTKREGKAELGGQKQGIEDWESTEIALVGQKCKSEELQVSEVK